MTSTPGTTPFDLLREKREELSLPDPVSVSVQGRQRLVQGVAIGTALIGISLGVTALVILRSMMVTSAIDRLGTVEDDVKSFETQLTAAKTKLRGIDKANGDLVKGLIAVRSGSAVLRDLQIRVPEGIQLIRAHAEDAGYRLKGVVNDPKSFSTINALQLLMKRSPLVDPNAVNLVKACREEVGKKVLDCLRTPARPEGAPPPVLGPTVAFEMFVPFRPAISHLAEKQILNQLGAVGLVRRFDLLKKEGLL
jgi:type IV pilus assembly protein PilN